MFRCLEQAKTSPLLLFGGFCAWIMSWFVAGTCVANSREPIMVDKSDSSAVGCLDAKAVREPFACPASFGMLSAVQTAMWFVSCCLEERILNDCGGQQCGEVCLASQDPIQIR